MRIAVIGLGATGARAARQLASTEGVASVVVHDTAPRRVAEVAASLGEIAEPGSSTGVPPDLDAAVLAVPAGEHVALTERLLAADVPVVSTADSLVDVKRLLDLGPEAAERGLPLVVGAAFSPGFTCVLALHAASSLDRVDEIHVAHVGTGGPACARQHHRALGGQSLEWRDRGWRRRPAGSGRELCWFPDPVGPADCYRAALAEPVLLVPAFPGVERVSARLAATRRDRFTAWLPMLRPPHPEGAAGAVRVEVRGARGNGQESIVLGAMDRPAIAAGAVAAVAAVQAASGSLRAKGAGGLASMVEPVGFLRELARRGVKAAVFEGV